MSTTWPVVLRVEDRHLDRRCRAWELVLFELDAPVASCLLALGVAGKDDHSHQLWAPLHDVDRVINTAMTDRTRSSVSAPGVDPGATGYLGHVGMLVLGETVAPRSHTPFADFVVNTAGAGLAALLSWPWWRRPVDGPSESGAEDAADGDLAQAR